MAGQPRVFVYGSLKTHLGNNVLLQRCKAKFLGYDSITGPFTMMSFGGFPGVIQYTDPERPVKTIFGEVWATDEEGLACLDLLEHHPNWYERFKYRTDILDVRAWMYTLPASEGYDDETRYAQVDECIWQPVPAELEFFKKQAGVDIA